MSRNFNRLDRMISYYRLNKIEKYIKFSGSICDLGCGDGDLILRLSKKYKPSYALGVDLNIANKKIGNVEFFNSDIVEVELEKDKFDSVLMLAVLEHIEREKAVKLINNANNILKKGGLLIITTPSPYSKPVLEFLAYKCKIISRSEVADHKHYYSLREVRKLLQRAGLKEIKSGYFQFFMNSYFIYQK